MSKHHLHPELVHRRNRIVRLFGRLHYFRVNVPTGHGGRDWWVND
jgi:hypothetical protein